jgi:carbamoyltransferase
VTDYLGFLRSSDEYKVMALASYGAPRYVDWFNDVVEPAGEGGYVVHPARLEQRFGPPRLRGEPLTEQHFDIAHSLQSVLESTVAELARWLRRATGSRNLCMAGGVALNCVLNGRLREQRIFDAMFVQPAAGDAGTALGAALWIDWNARRRERRFRMDHAYLGPEFTAEEIEADLKRSKQRYRRAANVADEAAALLAGDRILGWFQGRMEFGPRALGARSILASPLSADMQQRLNEIKDREDFRPVAPAVLEEAAGEWFVGAERAPFMLFVFDVVPEKAHLIPAVRHVDGTARVQTVGEHEQPLYHDLLKAFERRTGVPVLVNTSFNSRGEPVVCTPRDALESFWSTPLDALVIGPFIIEKPA